MTISNAKTTGVVYLMYFVAAMFAETLLSGKLIAYSNAVNIIAYGFYIALTLRFYAMFKPVNSTLSLVAACFSLAGCLVGILGLFSLAPPHVNALFFFGAYNLLIGYLIFQSTFLPQLLGALLMLAGLSWFIFLLPSSPKSLSGPIEIIGVVAEALLMLWLLFMGVNVERWKAQALA